MNFDFHYFVGLLFSTTFFFPALTSIWVTAACMAIGIALGLVVGIGLLSRSQVIRAICRGYVAFFRGIPSVVQIVFWYNVISELSANAINLPAPVAGAIALGIYESAYMAEIIRSAMLSIDHGQREAALSLGMRYRKATWRIIIPQAVRIALPTTGNEFVKMLKATALLFTIAVPELFAQATEIYSSNFRVMEVLCVVSIWYLGLTGLFSVIQRPVERHFSRFTVQND